MFNEDAKNHIQSYVDEGVTSEEIVKSDAASGYIEYLASVLSLQDPQWHDISPGAREEMVSRMLMALTEEELIDLGVAPSIVEVKEEMDKKGR